MGKVPLGRYNNFSTFVIIAENRNLVLHNDKNTTSGCIVIKVCVSGGDNLGSECDSLSLDLVQEQPASRHPQISGQPLSR